MIRIGIVSSLELPEPDVDAQITLDAFEAAGFQADAPGWDDPSVNWADYDLLLPRATWNYPEKPQEFKAWIDFAASQTILLNPPDILFENIDKSYLFKLEKQGTPIVPTEEFEENQFAAYFQNWDVDRIVIKPSIGAGSYLTHYFSSSELKAAVSLAHEITVAGSNPLVQPFMTAVSNGGERSLIWIDGQFTHRIIKQPRFDGQNESVSAASTPEIDEIELAEEILAPIESLLLYARVDLIRQDNQLFLNELELIEPSLFFQQKPTALDNLVAGVKKRISL
jgi:glutathione synthase/RimK-type ligase-like ATP-grasp enzyme